MVDVKILSGSRSIGGNFIRIEDGDRILVFDQGIRFDIMGNYYSRAVTPQGLTELRELGVLPRPEWYENVTSVYISHMHLDHLGALSNIPIETKAHLPSLSLYKDMEERWRASPSWLSLLPRKYYLKLEELKTLEEDKNNVMAIPVSHSAYPAYALLYFGKDNTVLYTGDFRVESFLTEEESLKLKGGLDLLTYLSENPDLKIDIFIVEGTNIGSSRAPLTPNDAMDIIKRIYSAHKPIIATLHGLDLEYAYTLVKLSAEFNSNCYVASSQIAKLLEKIPNLPLKPELVEGYVDYPTLWKKVALDEIEENSIILVPYWEVVDFLKNLSSTTGLIGDPVAIVSEPEPEIEEASEYEIIANWLSGMGIQCYRIRASGHYYPYQLKRLLSLVKPKRKIEVIHTLKPELFQALVEKVG
ncbi:MAG: hypothetical protein QXL46_04015 [Nitrososphaerales archaeon]